MALSSYNYTFGAASTGAITVDGADPAYIVDFIGDRDSEGFMVSATDLVQFAVGSDTDDSDASDATINTDTTGGTDTDGTFLLVTFSDTDTAPFNLSGLVAAINESANWNAYLIAIGTNHVDDSQFETNAGSTALTTLGQQTNFDVSSTDVTIGATTASLTLGIAKQLCIGPEARTDIRASLRSSAGDLRTSFDADPNDSDRSTTNTDEGPIYFNPSQSRLNRVIAVQTGTDSASDGHVDVYMAKQDGTQRLIYRETRALGTDEADITWDLDSTEVDFTSEPSERICVVSISTAVTTVKNQLTVAGKIGGPDSVDG